MSQLEKFQSFLRSNGQKLTGVDVPVVLSNESPKSPQLKFTFGWRIEIGVGKHSHGSCCPSGINCGSDSQAKETAHEAAKGYISGNNPMFNQRFNKILSDDVTSNFLLKSQNLRSAPDSYVGSERCHSCHGTGKDTCYSCHGRGKKSCDSCNGRGHKEVSKYDSYNERTVYTTESCSSCWGSGDQKCSTCCGCGSITCSTCSGGGYLYYSYTIDGDAKRSTNWEFNSNDYHKWTQSFIKKSGLNIINSLNNITEVDVEGDLDGCTFVYAFTAHLPTLQFTATIDNVATTMCFAGRGNVTHDAGGVYDPSVWSVGKNLGAGSKTQDTSALATPAIKDILEANETNTNIALLEENWVSADINNAVVANYQTLVTQLRKTSVKGIAPKMFTSLIKYSYLFFIISLLVALAFPTLAELSDQRMSVTQYPYWLMSLLGANFGLFGLPPLANYPLLLGLFWLCYQGVKKLYWKNLSKLKTYILTLGLTFILPHIGLSFFYNILDAMQHPPVLNHALVGASIFICLYLPVLGFNKPQKWYLKPLGFIAALAIYIVIQFAMMMLDASVGLLPGEANYVDGVINILEPAFHFVAVNIIEIALLSICFTYFMTRRQFWLKAKVAVADYNSPVLLKSMNMEQ